MNYASLRRLPTDDGSDDGALVRRILDGEKSLYAVLMRRYNQRLFRSVRAILRDDDESEDVVQHAYVVAYDKLNSFRHESSFGTWLTQIAIHEAFNRIRKDRRRGSYVKLAAVNDEVEMDDGDPELEVLRRETRVLLEKFIDRLPDSLRTVFVFRAVEELSTAETAKCLGLTEEAVRVRLHRARAQMRESISSLAEAAPDAFHFAGERCDRMVHDVITKLGI